MNNIEEYEIYDIHNHIFPSKVADKAVDAIGHFYDTKMRHSGSSEILLNSAKNAGIKKMLVFSAATIPAQTESINNFIKAECDLHDEFIGFGTIHPDNENIEEEIDRIISLGLRGIKFHPDFQEFDIDCKGAYKVYECCEGRLPIIFHMGDDRYEYSKPKRLAKVATDFPKLQSIAAHFGGYRCWDEALEYLMNFDNIMFDTSSTLGFQGIDFAKKLIKKFDTERLFFGTDFPMWDHKEELERFFSLGLDYETNKKILGDNFKKYFDL